MKVKAFFFLIIFVLVFGCASKPLKTQMLNDMAALDQVYIPTLVFTNVYRQRESEIALERFKKEWQKFYQHYHDQEMKYGLDIVDTQWPQDFEKMNALVISAEGYINDERLKPASASLEAVRFVLGQMRKCNGLEYFIDNLNYFDATLKQISQSVRGRSRLADNDLQKLKSLSSQALIQWQAVTQGSLEGELFGFDEEKLAALNQRIKKQQQVLERLDRAIRRKKQSVIFQSTQDVKPEFMVIYKAFGDFQPVFEIVKNEKIEKEAE